MTQYAAQQYTKWLSAITGTQYRLPTEAKWEYACRGGSSSAFYWGDDPGAAEQHAWFFENAEEGQKAVGQKLANPFGLHEMHGNVGEWTVNSFTDDGYEQFLSRQPADAVSVVVWPTETATSCVIRGGTWQSYAEELRCAARMVSDDADWKGADPNFPLSPWWFTSDPARGVGFRLFRSFKPLETNEIRKFWDNMAEDTEMDVDNRVNSDGKGKRGLVDKDLPAAIKTLASEK